MWLFLCVWWTVYLSRKSNSKFKYRCATGIKEWLIYIMYTSFNNSNSQCNVTKNNAVRIFLTKTITSSFNLIYIHIHFEGNSSYTVPKWIAKVIWSIFLCKNKRSTRGRSVISWASLWNPVIIYIVIWRWKSWGTLRYYPEGYFTQRKSGDVYSWRSTSNNSYRFQF